MTKDNWMNDITYVANPRCDLILSLEDFDNIKVIHKGETFFIDVDKLVEFLRQFKK